MHTLPKDLVRGKNNHNVLKNNNRHCHKSAALYYVVIPKWKDAGEMTNGNLVNVHEKEKSIYLM